MKLLTAQEVKNAKNKSDKERFERIESLKKAERDSVKRVNAALDEEKKIKEKLKEENMSVARREAKANVSKSIIIREIKALEKQRDDLLKPTIEREEQAALLLKEVKETIKNLEKKKQEYEKNEELLVSRFENLADREAEAEERHLALNLREAGIQSADEEMKRSLDKLSDSWVEFHKTVRASNEMLLRREKEIEDSKKANEQFLASLNAKEKILNDRHRQLADGYAQLAKSQKEILGKK